MTSFTMLLIRFRCLAVGIFLSLILSGLLIPSAAKAVPFDFTLEIDASICSFCTSGTLYFTYDDVGVVWDTERLSMNQVTTDFPALAVHNSFTSTATFPSVIRSHVDSCGSGSYTCDFTVQINSPDNFKTSFFLPLYEMRCCTYGEGYRGQMYTPYIAIPFPPARVPEPTTLMLMAAGLFALPGLRWWSITQKQS
jgi:hypothetical protein